MEKRDRRRAALIAAPLIAAAAVVALLIAVPRESPRAVAVQPEDAGTPPFELSTRAIPGFRQMEREPRPGLGVRFLLLGDAVHRCAFDDDFRAMHCAVIEHKTQYGPHDEPDIGFAETDAETPAWIWVSDRDAGDEKWELFDAGTGRFAFARERHLVRNAIFGSSYIAADGTAVGVVTRADEQPDDAYFLRPGEAPRALDLPPKRDTYVQQVGPWLLFRVNEEGFVARGTAAGLSAPIALPGEYQGIACHARAGTRMLGSQHGETLLHIEHAGRWTSVRAGKLELRGPKKRSGWAEERRTTLTCTESGGIVTVSAARRLDERKASVEHCMGRGQCVYALDVLSATCDANACREQLQRTLLLGDGGVLRPPRVLPMGDRLLVVWENVRGVQFILVQRDMGASGPVVLPLPKDTGLLEAWVRASVAAVLTFVRVDKRRWEVAAVRVDAQGEIAPIVQRTR